MTDDHGPPEGRDDTPGPQPRGIDLLAMGCRWHLDTSTAPQEIHDGVVARWQRAIDLAQDPDALVLSADPERLDIRPLDELGPSGRMVVIRDENFYYDLSRALTTRSIVRLLGSVTLLHGGALATPDGATVALVAESGGGKSTATNHLGKQLGYVTDEAVVIDPEGRVAAFPKPPSIIVDPADPTRKDEAPPAAAGLLAAPTRLRLVSLMLLQRDPEAAQPAIVDVPLLAYLIELLPQTSSPWLIDGALDRLARLAVADGGPFALRYAEIGDCDALVGDHLRRASARQQEGGPPVATSWDHHPAAAHQRPEGTAAPEGTELADDAELPRLIVRAPWHDAIAHHDELLVLQRERPARLAGIGAVLWLAGEHPRTVDEFVGAAVTEVGDHPDAAGLVRQALLILLRVGVMQGADAGEGP